MTSAAPPPLPPGAGEALRRALRPAVDPPNPNSVATALPGPSGVMAVRASAVIPEKVAWLWPGRLPLGKLVLLDGDPGLGKSTLTCEVGARVTTGMPLPDGHRPPRGTVVILSAEDGEGDTIRPRLEAAGADLERALILRGFEDPETGLPQPPAMPGDVGRLESFLTAVGAVLLIVDPLMSFLAGGVNSYVDHDVRRCLAPLSAMAERTGCAVLLVRHLSKSGGTNAVYRGGGSIGIVGAARAAMLVALDPDDPERRVLAVSKSNLAPIPTALAYRLVSADEFGCARVSWEGATDHVAGDLLVTRGADEDGPSRGTALAEAVEFLTDMLADGPVESQVAKANARTIGISERTLERAWRHLGIKPRKDGFAKGARWWLDPPGTDVLATEGRSRPIQNGGENGSSGENGTHPLPLPTLLEPAGSEILARHFPPNELYGPCHSCSRRTGRTDDTGRWWCSHCQLPA